MRYMDMVMSARKNGVTNENKMWQSIVSVDELLDGMPEEERVKFLRNEHCNLYGPHYDEDFAEMDIDCLEYTDRHGHHHKGEHWSIDDVEKAMINHPILKDSTKYDAYVAANVMYSDLCRILDDDEILKVTHEFFFNDDDAPEGKVWRYMSAMR